MNYDSVGCNPQMKLTVDSKSKKPVEVFMELTIRRPKGVKKFGIGFELYAMEGSKITGRNALTAVEANNGGYMHSDNVSFDGALADTGGTPLTLLITTFKPQTEAKFRFTVYYKHVQGTVSL